MYLLHKKVIFMERKKYVPIKPSMRGKNIALGLRQINFYELNVVENVYFLIVIYFDEFQKNKMIQI